MKKPCLIVLFFAFILVVGLASYGTAADFTVNVNLSQAILEGDLRLTNGKIVFDVTNKGCKGVGLGVFNEVYCWRKDNLVFRSDPQGRFNVAVPTDGPVTSFAVDPKKDMGHRWYVVKPNGTAMVSENITGYVWEGVTDAKEVLGNFFYISTSGVIKQCTWGSLTCSSTVTVQNMPNNIKKAAVADTHGLALTTDGKLYGWYHWNDPKVDKGQLGPNCTRSVIGINNACLLDTGVTDFGIKEGTTVYIKNGVAYWYGVDCAVSYNGSCSNSGWSSGVLRDNNGAILNNVIAVSLTNHQNGAYYSNYAYDWLAAVTSDRKLYLYKAGNAVRVYNLPEGELINNGLSGISTFQNCYGVCGTPCSPARGNPPFITIGNKVYSREFFWDNNPNAVYTGADASGIASIPINVQSGLSLKKITISQAGSGNISYYFRINNQNYVWNGSSWIPANQSNFMSVDSVNAIPEEAYPFLINSNTSDASIVAIFSGSNPVEIAQISLIFEPKFEVSELSCSSNSVYPGEIINCSAQITEIESGIFSTLHPTWQILKQDNTNGGIVESSETNNQTFTASLRPVGVSNPKTIKLKVCAQGVNAYCVERNSEIQILPVNAPQITGLTCPEALSVQQEGSCTVNVNTENVPPSLSLVYTWLGTSGLQVLNTEEQTGVVKPLTPGNKTVTVKVSYNYAPELVTESSASITAEDFVVTGTLTCPQQAYRGQTITCTIDYSASNLNTAVEWTPTPKSVSEDGKTAQIQVNSSTISVKVYAVNIPTLYKRFNTNVEVILPPKPVVNIPILGTQGVFYKGLPGQVVGNILCPEGNTCGFKWYLNDEELSEQSLQFSRSFPSTGRYQVKLVAWVEGIEEVNLVTSSSEKTAVVVNYPELSVSGSVDKLYVGVGDTIKLSARVMSRIDETLFPVKVTWMLPDGSNVEGKEVTYIVKETDGSPNKPVRKQVVFVYGYANDPSLGTKTGTVSFTVLPPYKLPDVEIKLYTPAEGPVPHGIVATANFVEPLLPGYNYDITYNWSVEGTNLQGDKKFFIADIETPGEYVLKVVVNDGLGNSVEKQTTIRTYNPLPWNVRMKAYLSNKFNVHPLTVVLRPELTGGHPKDKLVSYSWKVNGEEYVKSSIFSAKFNEPGTYNIVFEGTTKFGNNVITEYPLEVKPNMPPTCDLTAQKMRGMKVLYIDSKCTDPDGTIREFYWRVNDGNEFKGGSRITVRFNNESSVTIGLRVIDNGGNEVTVSKTFPTN